MIPCTRDAAKRGCCSLTLHGCIQTSRYTHSDISPSELRSLPRVHSQQHETLSTAVRSHSMLRIRHDMKRGLRYVLTSFSSKLH